MDLKNPGILIEKNREITDRTRAAHEKDPETGIVYFTGIQV
ncbi:hypothetical protein [Bacillus inaquosorum]|nr:hypothetical protein [Bacillus inaquosorum]